MKLRFIALVALVVTMTAHNTTFAKRRIARELAAEVDALDRFVDIGVRLSTVVADPNGAELIAGKPRLRVVGSRVFGGILDTRLATPRLVGPSRAPLDWYCSVPQLPVILHADTDPLGQLIYGSEGAGKTTALAMWTYLRWLESLGQRVEGGITSPTETRLQLVLHELVRLFPAHWFTYRAAESVMQMIDGTRLRLISTYQQSAALGSRIQGFSWSFSGSDEFQDSLDVADDIESRGRAARHGRYKQLRTATAKDSPDWRTVRDQLDRARDANGNPLWVRRTLLGTESPFVHPSFWAAKRATMSAREASRRLDAKDVGPERATYPSWSREHNLIDLPDLGWQDVTADELRTHGHNCTVLVGTDPGTLCDVSLFLKAYRTHAKQQRPTWVVLDELTTEGTTEIHVRALLDLVRERWRCNLLGRDGRRVDGGPQILVRADPAGNTDNRPDKSIYTQFRGQQILIKPAAYNADGDDHGRVPRDPGIEVVNTLLCNALQERRLFVARKPNGAPVAPKLVHALETAERDLAGKADTQRKGANDVSHWPAALRYALWSIERPRLQLVQPRGTR